MCTPGKPFAKSFRDTIGRLFRRLFRVYAHLYSNHFDHICALGIEGACFLSGPPAPLSPVPLVGRGADAIGGEGPEDGGGLTCVRAFVCSAPEHELPALLPFRERGEPMVRASGPGEER